VYCFANKTRKGQYRANYLSFSTPELWTPVLLSAKIAIIARCNLDHLQELRGVRSMFASPKSLLAASVVLLAGLPGFAAEETSSVAPMPRQIAVVKCPGITSVLFTADEEQALPLTVVGSLACGESVAVLSDSEGYTVHIRTSDGKEGFVARMYLAENSAVTPVVKPQPSVAIPVNGVVRWQSAAPGCDEFLSHGRRVESITANGVTVQVSLQDTGWKYRVNVAISNHSDAALRVVPGIITLDELRPKLRTLLATDSQKIAHSPTHQVLWTLSNAAPSPSTSAFRVLHNDSHQDANRPAPTPDYMSPHMTLASDHPSGFTRTESIDVESIILRPVTLSAGQTTAGVLWFDRDAGARELSLRVPTGDMVFDFSFSFRQKK